MNLSTLDKLSYTLELSNTLVELSYTLQWCFHLSCRGYFGGIFSPFFPSLFCFLYWNCILGWSICSCCYCPSHPLPLPHSLWKPVSMSACLFLSIPRKWSREGFFFFFFCQSKVYPLSTVLVHLDCHKGTPFPRLFPLYLGKMLSDSVLERRSVNSEPWYSEIIAQMRSTVVGEFPQDLPLTIAGH